MLWLRGLLQLQICSYAVLGLHATAELAGWPKGQRCGKNKQMGLGLELKVGVGKDTA